MNDMIAVANAAAFYSDGRYFLFYVVASPEEGAAAAATHVGFSEKGR